MQENKCKEGEEGGSVGEMRMGWQGDKFGKNNDGKGGAMYRMTLTESEICQVEDSCAWWLATIALLAFLCFKDVINSNRLLFLHLTWLHLMCPKPFAQPRSSTMRKEHAVFRCTKVTVRRR